MSPKESVDQAKKAAAKRVDTERARLKRLALKIHANPEQGYKEFKASAWLTEYLESRGFAVESGIYQIPTAFRATYGSGKPRIAVLAEYDALPGIGHGCGHNLICTIACGAAVASTNTVNNFGGTVIVLGTPAEEMFAGKIPLVQRGAFEDLDAALIVHPDGGQDLATSYALACQNLYIEYFGRSSHAAAQPERGINALDAIVLAFSNVNALRQHIRSSARIHGIITDGGQAANVIPDHSAGEFIVRAADDSYLDDLEGRVLNCFIGAGNATGARLEYRWDDLRYSAMKNNMALAQLYIDNMKKVGRTVSMPRPGGSTGSTDMGNVSQVVPAIHPMIKIAPDNVPIHSPEFTKAAASEDGINGMADAAKAVAMMIVDLLGEPDVLRRVREEFDRAA